MKIYESLITKLSNEKTSINIMDGYLNDDRVVCVRLVIGQEGLNILGGDGEEILLTKKQLEKLIEKLQLYSSRMD